ncbi:MAG: peptidylprolyl isomerase [Planctomycetota bacterium]|nr:peptidylprolyl isomerase [Planctomycetota bacterium]
MSFIKKMLRRDNVTKQAVKATIEPLEGRVLLSADGPRVLNAISDNRGLTIVYFDQALNASTVTTGAVKVVTAGPDGILNTADDVTVSASVRYGAPQQRIIINASLPADTAYWVSIKANSVLGMNGLAVDGEFSGTFPSGNGTPGGNFRMAANTSSSNSNRVARFTINGLFINVSLATPAQLPLSIPNFLNYANAGTYDSTFIHRNINAADSMGFSIIQGGGFFVSNDPVLSERTPNAPIAQETQFSNLQGTLAMANTSQPNSTQNEWYFNITNNQQAFGANYSVIGGVTGSGFLASLNTLNSFSSVNLTTTETNVPNSSRFGPDNVVSALTNVPVKNPSSDPNTLDPITDFLFVARVAIKDNISSLAPFPAPQVIAAAAQTLIANPLVATKLFATTIPITTAWNQLNQDNGGTTKASVLA